jgi:hypothetical protein
MSIGKLVLYLVGALLALMVASTAISAVFAAIALVWFLVRAAVALLVLGALGYGAYKLYQLVTGGSSQPSVSATGHTTSPSRTLSTGRYSTGTRSSGDTDRERQNATDTSGRQEFDHIEQELDSLKQQYANGDISESEFERRLERELDDREREQV